MNPFDSLGIEPRYDLDLVAAAQRHRDLSRTLHPDRFVGRPASERRLALSKSIEVNEAWRKLRDPVSRAEALLAHHGIACGEDADAKAGPDLLMEMMEHREALAEARANRNAEQLARLTSTMREREHDVVHALTEAFSRDLSGAPRLLGELRFVRRFLEQAATVEDELL